MKAPQPPPPLKPRIIYLGVKGSVLALDAATGQQIWATHLKGLGFVNVVLDGDQLYATTHGEIFCLDAMSGAGRWNNPLKGYGYGLVSVTGDGLVPNLAQLFAGEEQRRNEESSSTVAAIPGVV